MSFFQSIFFKMFSRKTSVSSLRLQKMNHLSMFLHQNFSRFHFQISLKMYQFSFFKLHLHFIFNITFFFQISNSNIILNENVQNVIKNVVVDKIDKFIFSLFMKQIFFFSFKTKSKKNNSLKMKFLFMQNIKIAYFLKNVSIFNISNFARNVSQLFDE